MRPLLSYFRCLTIPIGIAIFGGPSVFSQETAGDSPGSYSRLEDLPVDYFNGSNPIESSDESIPHALLRATQFESNEKVVTQSLTDALIQSTPAGSPSQLSATELVVQPLSDQGQIAQAPFVQNHVLQEQVAQQPVVKELAVTDIAPSVVSHAQVVSQATCTECENPYTCSGTCRKPFWLRSCYERYKRTLLGDPDLFCERPHGTYVKGALHSQIAVGTAQQMVLYHYDFHDGRDGDPIASLKPRGRRELVKLARLMMATGMPIVIEASDDNPQLDEMRRQQVLETLRGLGNEVSQQSVVVAHPELPGWNGLEAELLFLGRFNQTRLFSGAIGGGGGGGGGQGGGGGGQGGGGGLGGGGGSPGR